MKPAPGVVITVLWRERARAQPLDHVSSPCRSGVRPPQANRCGPTRALGGSAPSGCRAPRPGCRCGLPVGPTWPHAGAATTSRACRAVQLAAPHRSVPPPRLRRREHVKAAKPTSFWQFSRPPAAIDAAAAESRSPRQLASPRQPSAVQLLLLLPRVLLHLPPAPQLHIGAAVAGAPRPGGCCPCAPPRALAGAATGRPRPPPAQARSVAAPGAALRPSPAVAGWGFGLR
jgi:hypothetical protein